VRQFAMPLLRLGRSCVFDATSGQARDGFRTIRRRVAEIQWSLIVVGSALASAGAIYRGVGEGGRGVNINAQ